MCKEKYEFLSQSFPLLSRKKVATLPQISFSPEDLSSPAQFGSKLLEEANSICETHFQKSIEQVINVTPRSRLVLKPNSRNQLSKKRQTLREIKNQIQTDMNSEGDTLVLQNRLSWSRFDNVRKNQGLSGTKRKKPNDDTVEPTTKHRHGCHPDTFTIDKDQLLREARSWQPNEQVNWSQLGLRYGLSMPNRGQFLKEYLAEQGIQAVHNNQCKHRAPRRSKKRLPGGKVSFPMYCPVQKLKKKVSDRIESGNIPIGKEVVRTAYCRYTVHQGELRQESTEVYGRKIPLLEIRERLLKKHEELGVLRQMSTTQPFQRKQ